MIRLIGIEMPGKRTRHGGSIREVDGDDRAAIREVLEPLPSGPGRTCGRIARTSKLEGS